MYFTQMFWFCFFFFEHTFIKLKRCYSLTRGSKEPALLHILYNYNCYNRSTLAIAVLFKCTGINAYFHKHIYFLKYKNSRHIYCKFQHAVHVFKDNFSFPLFPLT